MKLFSEIEKTIERGFRQWTERMFGPAKSDELLIVHKGILEEVESKIQTFARGRRVFPFSRVKVTLVSSDAERRELYAAAFGADGRLERDIREALEAARCEIPRGFTVEVGTSESGDGPFRIEMGQVAAPVAKAPRTTPARVTVIAGKTREASYTLTAARTNIGRMAEITDPDHRVIRRNDIVFEEGADEANSTVSRKHAHIRLEAGEYRICDDESEFGTRVFRDGRTIETPAGNRRGERLRPGDEIYLGRACLRFEG